MTSQTPSFIAMVLGFDRGVIVCGHLDKNFAVSSRIGTHQVQSFLEEEARRRTVG